MIRLKIGDATVGIPAELLSLIVRDSIPKFLTGEEPPKGMNQAAIKSALKGIIPLFMSAIHKDIEQKHLPLMPPDLKCPAAKANVILYAISYLLANATLLADQGILYTTGEMIDGTFIVTGLTAPPALDAPPASESASDSRSDLQPAHAAIDEPGH